MMALNKDVLRKLWPRATETLVNAVVSRSAIVFAQHRINTPLRVAHFMAQISHESGGGTITEESLNYTTAARIAAVWPSRFTPESAQIYVRNPRLLANRVYNGRMGNRTGTDDGYNYRGRGLLQITGRESYDTIGKITGLDLVGHPDLAYTPNTALDVAAAEFEYLGCLPFCDKDDIRNVTRRVNGGYIGLDSRRAWLTKWKLALPELPGKLPTDQTEINDLDKPEPRKADPDVPPAPTPKQSTTIWSVIMQILSAVGAAIFGDWRVTLVVLTFIVLLALYIGRERILKMINQGV